MDEVKDKQRDPATVMATTGQRYDPPAIPLAPVLGKLLFRPARAATPGSTSAQTPSLLDCRYRLHVSSGRAGICLALETAGIGPGDEVLIPAFHCESMVSPAHWRGASAIFYGVNSDTTFNIDDIEAKISASTRALLVTHYFGFLQDLRALRDLCNRHGIILIEDCAHAFFGHREGSPVGSLADYAVSSSMKFFPVYDGGLLTSNRIHLDHIALARPPIRFQIKSLTNMIERTTSYGRLGVIGKMLLGLLHAKDAIRDRLKRQRANPAKLTGPQSSDGGYGLDTQWIHKSISGFSRLVIAHSDTEIIASQRRENYQYIHAALNGLPGAHALFPELPDGTVPLVYPLWVEEPERFFHPLKEKRVPIWRFGEYLDPAISADVFPDTLALSKHVFQFPCHQSLTTTELDWMLATIEETFAAASTTSETQDFIESPPGNRKRYHLQ